jgi:FAD/FMN-containing dehydrogenase
LNHLPSELSSLIREALALRTDAKERFGDPEARLSAQTGSGTLRIAVPHSPDPEGWVEWWVSALEGLRTRAQHRGGSMTFARAPLDLMRRVGYWGEGGPEQAIMRRLKDEFDPRGIMAPGRMGL